MFDLLGIYIALRGGNSFVYIFYFCGIEYYLLWLYEHYLLELCVIFSFSLSRFVTFIYPDSRAFRFTSVDLVDFAETHFQAKSNV